MSKIPNILKIYEIIYGKNYDILLMKTLRDYDEGILSLDLTLRLIRSMRICPLSYRHNPYCDGLSCSKCWKEYLLTDNTPPQKEKSIEESIQEENINNIDILLNILDIEACDKCKNYSMCKQQPTTICSQIKDMVNIIYQ